MSGEKLRERAVPLPGEAPMPAAGPAPTLRPDPPPPPPARARHVGVLLDNPPDYLFALGGAALSGSAVVGVNHPRRDEHLLRDIEHTHCGLVVTEPRHAP